MTRWLPSKRKQIKYSTLIGALLVLSSPTIFAEEFPIPQITFQYGAVLDAQCDDITGSLFEHEIKPGYDHKTEIMQEAWRLTDTLQQQWDDEGAPLLRALFDVVGRGYPRNELIAYTEACNMRGMSVPFVVGVRVYLKSVRKEPTPVSNNLLVTLHEFLHKYLVATFDYSRSEVLKQFADESPVFKNHLHLMALMKSTLLRAGREDLAKQTDELFQNVVVGPYAESWKIGTSDEFYDRLINEVRQFEGDNRDYWFGKPMTR